MREDVKRETNGLPTACGGIEGGAKSHAKSLRGKGKRKQKSIRDELVVKREDVKREDVKA